MEEFPPDTDPELLAGFLGELAALAVRARTRSHHLYCLVML